jgi:vitamin B12 transporter
MKKRIFWFGLLLCSILHAQNEQNNALESLDTVYIDSKTPLTEIHSGKVIAKVTADYIKQHPGKTVAQMINEQSGIEINGSRGYLGQNPGYFVRGGRNRQVVILVDGVQLTDPSVISNDYDLRFISPTEIDHIEIIKGASSVLYGTGAGTAVISIRTKEPEKKGFNLTSNTSLGTNRAADDDDNDIEELLNSVNINGRFNSFSYQMSFNHQYTDGLSAVSAPEGQENYQEDVFNSFSGNVNLGYQINDQIKINRFFKFNSIKAGFDDFSYQDANHSYINKQLRTGGAFHWKFKKGKLSVNDSHSWIDREIMSFFPTQFDSKTSAVDAFMSYPINSELTILAGINGHISSFNSYVIPFGGSEFEPSIEDQNAQFEIIDPYLNVVYLTDFGLNLNAGLRLNNHSAYGDHMVYQVNPSFVFPLKKGYLKFLGSYSTAYITPSLYQLYEPSFGNNDLKPEENATLEGGIELKYGKELKVSAVYFSRDEKNLVDFVLIDPDTFQYQYQNISEEFNASGIEVELTYEISQDLSFSANYTNTQADERFALRIPEHKVNAYMKFNFNESIHAGLGFQWLSDRDDSYFDPDTFIQETITLESYKTIDLNAGYQLNRQIYLYAQVLNILDVEYEELYRFQTLGRNVRLGFQLKL